MTKSIELIKAISLLLIPLVIAGGGWMIQKSIQNSNLDRDYVQIAISILQDKDSSEGLRTWATEILNKKSPVPLQNSLAKTLINGSSSLPSFPFFGNPVYQSSSSIKCKSNEVQSVYLGKNGFEYRCITDNSPLGIFIK